MPKKEITQRFIHAIDVNNIGKKDYDYDTLLVVASNTKEHRIVLNPFNRDSTYACISTSQMKALGEFLIKIAKQIEDDPDYNKNA